MDDNKSEISWGIPDPLCYTKMHGILSGVGTLTTFPYASSSGTSTSRSVEGKVKMHCIEKVSPVWGKYYRKLINETAGIFLSLQSGVSPDGDHKPLIVKKSREYRSVIQLCIMEMKETIDSNTVNDSSDDKTEFTATYQLLYKMELVLSLIEILFIDSKPGGVLLNQLLNWIRLHFVHSKTKMCEILLTDEPHLHVSYWDTCYGLVLQGRLDETRDLLGRHINAHTDPFLSLDELLRKMPIFQAYGGVTTAEFSVRWDHWQSECKARLERGEFTSYKPLETICRILCGDEEVFCTLTDLMDTWYHVMVSTLLYTNPTVQMYRLYAAAQDAISQMDSPMRLASLDHLLLACTEGDAHQVIKLCQQVLDNVWFTSHLSDLLYHTLGYKPEHKYLKDIREFLLIDYGSELVAHPSLWQVGLLYLEGSGGAQGGAMAGAVLQRLPLNDDSKARKVIQAASQRNLDHIVVSVCRVMGRRALSEGRLGAAIWWGVRSRDAAFTSYLAHQILHKYVADGEFESSSLLDNLGASMLLSDTLTFLGKYREFHGLYQEENFSEAASLLVSLISSNLAPQYFWPVLLVDALPLLEYYKPVISSDQTYQLMYCLHNLSDKHNKETPKNNGAMSTFKEKEKEIRQALTSNLARAIVQEGSIEE